MVGTVMNGGGAGGGSGLRPLPLLAPAPSSTFTPLAPLPLPSTVVVDTGAFTLGKPSSADTNGGGKTWTASEDQLLRDLIKLHGGKDKWYLIAESFPGRSERQCRNRWETRLEGGKNTKSALDTDIPWTAEEEIKLARAHSIVGGKWSEIAKLLPGRTEAAIKQHWTGHRRRLQQLLVTVGVVPALIPPMDLLSLGVLGSTTPTPPTSGVVPILPHPPTTDLVQRKVGAVDASPLNPLALPPRIPELHRLASATSGIPLDILMLNSRMLCNPAMTAASAAMVGMVPAITPSFPALPTLFPSAPAPSMSTTTEEKSKTTTGSSGEKKEKKERREKKAVVDVPDDLTEGGETSMASDTSLTTDAARTLLSLREWMGAGAATTTSTTTTTTTRAKRVKRAPPSAS